LKRIGPLHQRRLKMADGNRERSLGSERACLFTKAAFQSPAIPEQETALCLDCQVLFSIRQRTCPQCGGDDLWLIAHWRGAARPTRVPSVRSLPALRRPARGRRLLRRRGWRLATEHRKAHGRPAVSSRCPRASPRSPRETSRARPEVDQLAFEGAAAAQGAGHGRPGRRGSRAEHRPKRRYAAPGRSIETVEAARSCRARPPCRTRRAAGRRAARSPVAAETPRYRRAEPRPTS
jgi:hypothetical protein